MGTKGLCKEDIALQGKHQMDIADIRDMASLVEQYGLQIVINVAKAVHAEGSR